ncbi:unnamed protein product [Durusdinium trenchii]|uniref:Uncharacterized protein n=2 Tax=Durusdinium trenchii TaxID=1381693 RepID=A0ABP0PQL2_9DINO
MGATVSSLEGVCLGRSKKVLLDYKFKRTLDRVTSLISLEHLNVNVPAWNSELEIFWMKGLGFAADSRAEEVCNRVKAHGGSLQGLVWANAGLQQVHMPVGEPSPMESQSPPGFLGLAYSDIKALRSNLKALSIDWCEVWSQETVQLKELGPPALKVKSPTGVTFVIHAVKSLNSWLTPEGWMDQKELQEQNVSLPSSTPSVCLGIPYMRFMCPAGTAAGLARFYEEIFCTQAELKKGFGSVEECWVPVGASQWLIYREAQPGEAVPYDGYHIAIYINHFVDAYRRAKERQLVWNNPRFPNTTYDTEDLAVKHSEFRILKLVDPMSGEILCEVEHEIRAASHPGFCAKEWLGNKTESQVALNM